MAEPRRALRGRFLRRQICDSKTVADLIEKRGPWAGLLFERLILHADDDGRFVAEAAVVKAKCLPWHKRGERAIQSDLDAMQERGLISLYVVDGCQYGHFPNWAKHQPRVRKDHYIPSELPPPSGIEPWRNDPGPSPYRWEAPLVERLSAMIEEGELRFGDLEVTSVEQEVRLGNSYADLLVTTKDGPKILIEAKRWRLSQSALAQIERYLSWMEERETPCLGVLIGYGMTSDFDAAGAADKQIAVLVFDGDFAFRQVVDGGIQAVISRESSRNDTSFRGNSPRRQEEEEEEDTEDEEDTEEGCESACNNDPLWGVIGVEK